MDPERVSSGAFAAQVRFFLAAVQGATPRVFSLTPRSTRPTLVWSDASWALGPSGLVSRLCWLAIRPGSVPEGAVYDIPPQFWERLTDRVTQIAAAETLAWLMLLRDGPDHVKGASALALIDNVVALVGLVRGHSAACDLAGLFLAASERTTQLGAAPWFEWVPSHSNPADGGSRVGVTDAIAQQAGIPLNMREFPLEWPCLHINSAPDWQSFWP